MFVVCWHLLRTPEAWRTWWPCGEAENGELVVVLRADAVTVTAPLLPAGRVEERPRVESTRRTTIGVSP